MNDQQANRHLQKLPLEINGQQFMELLVQTSVVVIDVREIGEFPVITLKNQRQIPMSSFNESSFDGFSEQNIIIVCQHGVRSLSAAEMMQGKFKETKNIYSLKGGIVRWKL